MKTLVLFLLFTGLVSLIFLSFRKKERICYDDNVSQDTKNRAVMTFMVTTIIGMVSFIILTLLISFLLFK